MRGGLIAAASLLIGCAAELGPRCAVDGDCVAGEVCGYVVDEPVDDQAPLPTRCRAPGGGDGDPCTGPDDCTAGVCLLGGACARPCIDDLGCDGGAICHDAWARGVDDDHLHPTRACTRDVFVPEGVAVTRSLIEGGVGSFTQVILPGTTSGSATYSVVPYDRVYVDNLIPAGVLRIETIPDGTSLLEPSDGLSVGTLAGSPVFSFAIPFGHERAYSAEGYLVELGGFGNPVEGGYEPVEAELIHTSRTERGRTLDLDVFLLVGFASGSTAERFESARADVQVVLDQADIELGSVRYHTVGGGLAERYRLLTSGGWGQSTTQKGELMRLSLGIERPSVAVFVVDDLMDLTGRRLQGVSCGIPGPQGVQGTEASGIVISWGATFHLPHVLVHELGHFLGLRHTTERFGALFDGFDDTPECPIELDADGDGEVHATECAEAGADNVMFWGEGGTRITESQARVLQSSPLLR